MLMQNFDDVIAAARKYSSCKMAVAVAQDEDVLTAVGAAQRQGLVGGFLVGDQDKIAQAAQRVDIDLAKFDLVHEPDAIRAARCAVQLVSSGRAHMLMKGMVNTADLLRAVLDKEIGLRTGRVLSHVAVAQLSGYDRLILLTDGAMNIAPDLKQKAQIIHNAVVVAHALGISVPKVAPLAAVEVVNPDMQATLDAAALSQMAARGQIAGCIVDGPLALDNAVSLEAAKHKGIKSPVAGQADILLVPAIEVGNVLYKSFTFFAHGKTGGVIAGAKAPIVLTSRADSPETKLNSIALGVVVSQH